MSIGGILSLRFSDGKRADGFPMIVTEKHENGEVDAVVFSTGDNEAGLDDGVNVRKNIPHGSPSQGFTFFKA